MARQTFDPYAILGLEPDASEHDVAQAHRRLAKRYHPDLNPGAEATERMRRINEARAMLSNGGRMPRGRWSGGASAMRTGGRGTAAWRGEWPPRSPTTAWATSAAQDSLETEPWPTWRRAGRRIGRSAGAGRNQATDDLFGNLGCALLLIAAVLLWFLVRIPF